MKNKHTKRNKHWGSSLDALLRTEGKLAAFQARAIKEAAARRKTASKKPAKRKKAY
jgi:hypothetical protein